MGASVGRRRVQGSKLDLTQKSRSANDVLDVDVVGGGGGDSNDSCARSLNGTSVTAVNSGRVSTDGKSPPTALVNGPIMGGRLQFFKGELDVAINHIFPKIS